MLDYAMAYLNIVVIKYEVRNIENYEFKFLMKLEDNSSFVATTNYMKDNNNFLTNYR